MKKSKKLEEDRYFMRKALLLAEKGRGQVSPNPLVGAVVVKAGKVIASGFHQEYGGPHAEVMALNKAGKRANGATLYLTLEPCLTYGKTPPCVLKIIDSKIKRVVVATRDPNPGHSGKGLDLLRKRGIRVTENILEKDARELICYFSYWIKHKKPYVIVKQAMSLDGKIATRTYDSKWISSAQSRQWVHGLRSQVDAVLIGKGTAQKDNPQLTCRIKNWNGVQPLRFVLTRTGKISPKLKIFSSKFKNNTFLIFSSKTPEKIKQNWEKLGISFLSVPVKGKQVDLKKLLQALGDMGITSLLVEGGSETVGSFFDGRLVNLAYFFIAPKVIGGSKAPTAVGGKGAGRLAQAIKAKNWSYSSIGDDLLLEARF